MSATTHISDAASAAEHRAWIVDAAKAAAECTETLRGYDQAPGPNNLNALIKVVGAELLEYYGINLSAPAEAPPIPPELAALMGGAAETPVPAKPVRPVAKRAPKGRAAKKA